jgi:hypothetical protein
VNTTTQERSARLAEYRAAVKRQGDYLDALIDVPLPDGITREEVRWCARRFAQLVDEAGPRRGLCRFGRSR